MIVSDKDLTARLNSPNNLINRLRGTSQSSVGRSPSDKRSTAMSLFGVGRRNEVQQKTIIPPAAPTAQIEQQEVVSITFNPFADRSNSVDTARLVDATQLDSVDATRDDSTLQTQSQPNLDNLLSNAEQQVKLSIAHDRALETLTHAVNRLNDEIPTMSGSKLPSAITAATKVVEVIRRERSEAAKNNKGGETHYHFYTPVQKPMESYEVIEVNT